MHAQQTSTRRPLVLSRLIIVLGLVSGFSFVVVDKSQYYLLNFTLRELMRAMSMDRSDLTESVHTVDAGYFQLEVDLVNFSHDHDIAGGADTKVDVWTVGVVNFKVGLLNWMDLQLVLDVYNYVSIEDWVVGIKVRQLGLGDFIIRVKMNFWGNDGGKIALVVMSFVKFPINQDDLGNNEVEGGFIIPFGMELFGGWSLGVMMEFDFVRNNADIGYRTDFVNFLVVGRDLIGKFGGYVEFFSVVSSEFGNPWVGVLGLGLVYAVMDDL